MSLTIQITHTYTCAKCGIYVTRTQEIYPGGSMIMPELPEGWHEVDGQHYCPLHTIVIT